MKYLFLDTETTGTDKNKNGVHQISGAIIIDNKILEIFDYKFRPNENLEIDDKALEVCNITKEELLSRDMSEKEAYQCFINLLSKYVNKFDKIDKFFLVGYNVHFDKDMLYEMFVRCNDLFLFSYIWGNHIDVMVLATLNLISVRAQMSNFKQGTVAKFLGFKFDENSLHDALFDIYICIGLFSFITGIQINIDKNIIILSEEQTKLETLLKYFSGPLVEQKQLDVEKIITFGKHKNKRLGDVINEDPQYLIWLYENAQNQNIVDFELYNNLKQSSQSKNKKHYYSHNDKVIDHFLDSGFDCCDY